MGIIFYSEEDVLHWLASQVDTTKEFCICVSRVNLLEQGLMLWQRQKNSSPVNPLKVTFMGEAGVDTGALNKEFLTGQDHYIFLNLQINMTVIHKVSSVCSPFEW